MKLFERVEIIAIYFEGSRAGLAKRLAQILDKTPRAIEGYFNVERECNLWPILDEILKLYPIINDTWLYLERGPMLNTEQNPPELSSKNYAGKYTGDLLNAALGLLHLPPEDAAKELGWDISELRILLESRVAPSFRQLETLHFKLHINPIYFFDGNERQMHQPNNLLLQVFHMLGQGYTEPESLGVAEIFCVPEEEARQYLAEWRKERKEGRNKELPPHWLENLETCYSFNSGWLGNGNPPIIQKKMPKTSPSANISFFAAKEGKKQKPPTPHIDEALLMLIIGMLEERLKKEKGKLPPAPKAFAITQIYEMVLENEESDKAAPRLRLVTNALAKVVGE